MTSIEPVRPKAAVESPPRVAIVLVNWNRPWMTERCLESVFANEYPAFDVILCDNGSTDESLETFVRWAKRRDGGGHGPGLVAWTLRDAAGEVRERGGQAPPRAGHLHLVDLGENLGFAGGCNAGMALARELGDARYVWLLNNDTTIDVRALSHLVHALATTPGAGFCGSTVFVAGEGERVQTLGGGVYDPWLGRTRLFPREVPPTGDAGVAEAVRTAARLDFVVGTSMLVDVRVLEEVGPMCEDYFLYFEELDWVRRARGRFGLAYAHESLVYHDVGGTIGSRTRGRERTLLSDYYGIRNRILFTRRHHPLCLPTVYFGLLLTMLVRLGRRQPGRATMILWLALWGLGLVREERMYGRFLGAKQGALPRALRSPAP